MEYMKKSVLNLQPAEIDLNCCFAFHTFDIVQSNLKKKHFWSELCLQTIA